MSNLDISEVSFSDHMPVLFDISIPCYSKPSIPARRCCIFTSSTAVQFSAAFQTFSESYFSSPSYFNFEELTSLLNSTCQSALTIVAPFKVMHPKPKTEPWINDITRVV